MNKRIKKKKKMQREIRLLDQFLKNLPEYLEVIGGKIMLTPNLWIKLADDEVKKDAKTN